jgi:hypothetical protein
MEYNGQFSDLATTYMNLWNRMKYIEQYMRLAPTHFIVENTSHNGFPTNSISSVGSNSVEWRFS